MTAAVRKKDEELTIYLKCKICGLMTYSGLTSFCKNGCKTKAISALYLQKTNIT